MATTATTDTDVANNNGSMPSSTVTTLVTATAADLEVTKTGPASVMASDTVDYYTSPS